MELERNEESPFRLWFHLRSRLVTKFLIVIIAWNSMLLAAGAESPNLLPLPDVRQSTPYSCGAAALQSVLAYWGIEIREDQLMELLGTDPEIGTPPRAIVTAAESMGLKAGLQEELSLEKLAVFMKEGIPVIVAAQAWREQSEGDWSEEWECGHYMVVIGIDQDNVYFEDPSLLGSRGFIPRDQFLERWHDVDGKGRQYLRLGIPIQGTKIAPPPALAPVD